MSSVAKNNEAPQVGLVGTLLSGGLYKPSQGRVVRQLTALSVAVIALLASYELGWAGWVLDIGRDLKFSQISYAVFLVLGLVGIWVAFRIVNVPRYADFMIAVEAEMKKVSWPTRKELWRASVVVIFVIFAMAGLLWVFDVIWTWVFKLIGIRAS